MLEIIASNTNNTQTQGQMADVEISGHNHQSTSNIGDSITSDDRTNSPRELTPERRGQEEKEKRKKKVKCCLNNRPILLTLLGIQV